MKPLLGSFVEKLSVATNKKKLMVLWEAPFPTKSGLGSLLCFGKTVLIFHQLFAE